MEIIPSTKTNIVLDATMLSNIQSCGRLTDFRFNYNYKSREPKSDSLEMGSIVHAYLEHSYGARINGIGRSEAHGFGMTAARAYADSPEVTNPKTDIPFALETCEEYNKYYINDPWTPLEVETVKSKLLYTDDNIRILWKAKLDYIADTAIGIMPIDHKTMKQRRDTLTLNNQFTGQCFVMGTTKVFVNKIGFQKTLPPKDRFARVALNYTADQILEWQEEIVPYWAYQFLSYKESGYWPPNYTHCENKFGYCQFKDVCSVNRNLRDSVLQANFEVGEPWSI